MTRFMPFPRVATDTMDDTEIMSRYLQRGATMLGDHCDDCGNPLFRVDGDEVCVVCAAAQEEAAARDDDGAPDGRDRASGGPAESGTERTAAADRADALTASGGDVDEIRRNVVAVARRVSRDARDERELSRLRDQMAVLEHAVEVLDELG